MWPGGLTRPLCPAEEDTESFDYPTRGRVAHHSLYSRAHPNNILDEVAGCNDCLQLLPLSKCRHAKVFTASLRPILKISLPVCRGP